VGTGTPDAERLERMVDYRYYQHEVLRSLEVVGLAGAATSAVGPAVAVTAADRAASAAVVGPPAKGRPRLAIHPGAADPRRRWPVERFAAVAARAADAGYEVLVIGDASEADLGQAVIEEAGLPRPGRGSLRSLAGQLDLGALAGLLESCDVMLGNDSGPRHLAQAVGTPTAGIYWVGNAIMAAPLGRAAHRVQIGWTTRCPSCGADVTQVGWTAPHCGHDFSLIEAVDPAEVFRDVVDLTATSPRLRGR